MHNEKHEKVMIGIFPFKSSECEDKILAHILKVLVIYLYD
jgi:hypothetical protein